MTRRRSGLAALACAAFCIACDGNSGNHPPAPSSTLSDPPPAAYAPALRLAGAQLTRASDPAATGYPFTTNRAGRWYRVSLHEWTAGLLPGSLWALYDLTGEALYRERALLWQAPLEARASYARTHDGGLVFGPSFARAFACTADPRHAAVAEQAARALSSRYRPAVGALEARDRPPGPVRVQLDTMAQLPLLVWATRVRHLDEAGMRAHAHGAFTAQRLVDAAGQAHAYIDVADDGAPIATPARPEQASARAHALALLGFATLAADEGGTRYQSVGRALAERLLAASPPHGVLPYRFDDPSSPPDSSASAALAAALADWSLTEDEPHRARYRDAAEAIVAVLGSPEYLATEAASDAVLLHGTHDVNEASFDTGTAWGDYFFLDALTKLSGRAGRPCSGDDLR